VIGATALTGIDGKEEEEEEEEDVIERLTTLTAFFGCCFLTTAFFGFCSFCCLAKMRGVERVVVIGGSQGGERKDEGEISLGNKKLKSRLIDSFNYGRH